MIAYNLINDLNPNHIIHDIQKLISKTPKDILDQSILVISLQKFTDYTGDNPIPKITYEGDSLT